MVLLLSAAFVVVGAVGFLYLQSLNDKIAALDATGSADPALLKLPETVQRLEQRLSDAVTQNNEQEEKLTRLEQQLAASAQQATAATPAPNAEQQAGAVPAQPVLTANQLATLEQRIVALETAVTQHQDNRFARQFALLNGLWMLQFKLDHALPFAQEIRTMVAFSQNLPGFERYLEPLRPFAEDGIKTLDDLRHNFRDVAQRLQEKARSGADELPWYKKTINNIKGVVVIRHVEKQAESTRPQDVVANVEALLTSGDLNLAVLELEKLPASYHDITAAWVTQAKARLDAEISVASLYEQLLLLTDAEQIIKPTP